jgi:hypothetical protein
MKHITTIATGGLPTYHDEYIPLTSTRKAFYITGTGATTVNLHVTIANVTTPPNHLCLDQRLVIYRPADVGDLTVRCHPYFTNGSELTNK